MITRFYASEIEVIVPRRPCGFTAITPAILTPVSTQARMGIPQPCFHYKSGHPDLRRMKSKLAAFTVAFFIATAALAADDEPNWIVAEGQEGGNRVIFSFLGEMPAEAERDAFGVLTVIEWKYDGAGNEGLPSAEERERINTLEDTLDQIDAGILRPAFSRTGNNLKELAYYIGDRKRFLESLNRVLRGHPKYHIEISFYEDPQWRELERFIDGVQSAEQN